MTVLHDHKEMMNGRPKELNSLKEVGAMTAVKRSEVVGKGVNQTRWVDREKDGCAKSRLVLKDFNRSQGVLSRGALTDTINTASEKQRWLQVRMNETNIQNATTSQMQLTYTQHSCTLTLTKSCLQSHQNPTNGMNQSWEKTKCGN